MEKRGSGLRKIQDATSMLPTYKEDKRPYFESSYDFFYTTIPNVNYGMSQNDLEIFAVSKDAEDKTYPENEKIARKNRPENQKPTQKTYPENEKPTQKKVGKTAQKIIDILVQNPRLTRREMAVLVGKSEDTIKLHLTNLQSRGIIRRVGSDRGGYWKVII